MKPHDPAMQRLFRDLVTAMIRDLDDICDRARRLEQDLLFAAADAPDSESEDRLIGLPDQAERIGVDLESIVRHLARLN